MKKLLKKLIPDFILYWYHWKWALMGALIYGFPSRQLKVIGVTGTKGKSTVVFLAGNILKDAGKKVGWISSLTINDGKKEVMNPYHMTMPGRFFVQKTLRQMVKNGCEYALVEVTSEGIKQSRHRFIKWAGAVFTNLAPEHLEAHGGFEQYRVAKMKLFSAVAKNPESFGVYNLDDENVQYFLKHEVKNKFGYTLKSNPQSILNVKNVQLSASGSEFETNDVKFKTNLLGEFNVYNCVAAAAIGLACGVPLEISAAALGKIKAIPGRLEIINEGQDFMVVVDLAHTPDSFAKVFKLFKELSGGRIISVFGSAGGGRDKWKRPELGRIASENSDLIIICNEDPYDENPSQILSEIKSGIFSSQFPVPNLFEIQDRRNAIAKALSLARQGDIVLILGKGTEQTYVEGNKKIAWDDRIAVRKELKKLQIK
ncbi:MAG: UDP-N-acetylmuramyl-tripeptide synthetase [Parcubacteria group bacterium GW2011_GWA2_42_11]|nr:MAG: UDP-N-acetylmuramyl-tripeptide synthetase [Parcubacteria group bacterium GW2011_GWA2_42_11]